MDAELKAYLDRMVEMITGIIREQGDRLAREIDGLRRELEVLRRDLEALRVEVRDGFIAVGERFRTLEQRITKRVVSIESRLAA